MEKILQLISVGIKRRWCSTIFQAHAETTYLLDEAHQVAKYMYPVKERHKVEKGSPVLHYELRKNQTEVAE